MFMLLLLLSSFVIALTEPCETQTDAPNTDLIEAKDILGPTVILLTCSYMEQEFIRIGALSAHRCKVSVCSVDV